MDTKKNKQKKQRLSFLFIFNMFFAFLLLTSLSASAQDNYEPDESANQATIITVFLNETDGEPQQHNFYAAEDEDWVKFYALAENHYVIKVVAPQSRCDAALELYGQNGTTRIAPVRDDAAAGEEEALSFLCEADGVYFVKVSSAQKDLYGDSTGYGLICVFKETAPSGTGQIYGTIHNEAGEPVENALIKTQENTTAISYPNGYFLLSSPAGTSSLTVNAQGYAPATKSFTVNVSETKDIGTIILVSGGGISPICLVETIYGAHAPETELLRNYRDSVLRLTVPGRKAVELYYTFSPSFARAANKSQRVKNAMRGAIDFFLPCIFEKL